MNRLATRVEELEDMVEELEDKVASWVNPSEDYEKIIQAVNDFCYVCPLKDDMNCILCDLHKWRNKKEDV